MSSKKIKVAAAQMLTGADLAANLKKVTRAMRDARREGARIVLFHEGCLTGYPHKRRIKRVDFKAVRRAEGRVRKLAAELGLAVLLGSTSREDRLFYNDVLIINEKGLVLGRYAKTWRAGEEWYTAGSGPVIFRVAGVQATVIICHDLRYPELPRLAVAAGAQIVFISNNESGVTFEHKLLGYRSMQVARGTENLVYAVMANAPADPADPKRSGTSHGNSKIVDPMGNILEEAHMFEERLVLATLDLSQATRSVVLRTTGESEPSRKRYGTSCEHPAIAEWMRAGRRLVRRLK